jgi:MtfA peptidase
MPFFNSWKRRSISRRTFPRVWQDFATENVQHFRHLKPSYSSKLINDMKIFIAEKRFEGCGGLEMTDEIRVTVAAQACLLLLGDASDYFPDLRSILIYPDSYIAQVERRAPDNTIIEGDEHRSGEAWNLGAIVLSWKDVLAGGRNRYTGRNLIFHEFAHQLDYELGATQGVMFYRENRENMKWPGTILEAAAKHSRNIRLGKPTVLDSYGDTNLAEFFAVSVEAFMEQQQELKREYPAYYQQLCEQLGFDPAEIFL